MQVATVSKFMGMGQITFGFNLPCFILPGPDQLRDCGRGLQRYESMDLSHLSVRLVIENALL